MPDVSIPILLIEIVNELKALQSPFSMISYKTREHKLKLAVVELRSMYTVKIRQVAFPEVLHQLTATTCKRQHIRILIFAISTKQTAKTGAKPQSRAGGQRATGNTARQLRCKARYVKQF